MDEITEICTYPNQAPIIAMKTEHGSNIDSATVHPLRLLPTKLAMADEAFEVLLETGIRIQPLPIWEDEWANPDHYSNPRLLKNISREGLRL